MKTTVTVCASLAVSLVACAPNVKHAPDPEVDLRSAIETARQVSIEGPANVTLVHRTVLQLQDGLVFIPAKESERLLRLIGESPKKGLLGVVVFTKSNAVSVAAVYGTDSGDPEMPQLEVVGWNPAPALIGFEQR